jgi:uncharacterized membrane protein YgcG
LILALVSCLIFGAVGAATTVLTRGAEQSASNGRSWSIQSGETLALRNAAGALGVKESVNVDFAGGVFRGFYRDVPLSPQQTAQVLQVSDSKLGAYKPGGSTTLGSDGTPGEYGSENLPQGLRIVWHHDSIGKKTFGAIYAIQPVGDRYADADYLRVSLWGDDWPSFVPRVNGTLRLASPLPAGAQVGTLPTWIGAKTKVLGKDITLVAKNIPARQGLSVAIRLPRGALLGEVVTHSGNAPAAVQGSPLDGIRRKSTDSPGTRFLVWGLTLVVVGQLPVWGWLIWNRRRLTDAPWDGAGGFEYKPPEGQSLAEGYVAADETQPPSDRAYVATLMDLVARGFYSRENVRDEKSGDWRLEIALPGARDQTAQLSEGETAVLNFTDTLLAQGPCVVDSLDSRVSPTEHRIPFSEMKLALANDGNDLMRAQRSANWWVKLVASVWLVGVAYLTIHLTAPASTVSLTVSLIAIVAVFLISTMQMRAWPRGDFVQTPAELAPIQGAWQQWRDWILHFDQMNEAPDLGVILWERAFAGALMWGVAEKFVARAKVLVPDLDQGTLAMGNSAFYGAALGSSISSSATPASSDGGSFGGGSFGGGGGGGGGGAW